MKLADFNQILGVTGYQFMEYHEWIELEKNGM